MAELTDIFASIDANKDTREVNDKVDYDNQSYDFSPDVAEASGIYFIPEGDKRLIDKINFNFKKIIETPTPTFDYVSIDADHSASDNEFILCDTTNLIAQKEEISSINVLNDNLYSVTINEEVRSYTSTASATLTEILDGLVDAINLSSEPVTATKVNTEIEILSNVPGTSFTISSNGQMTINNLIQNKTGDIILTLPDTTGNIVINLLDIKNNFNSNNVILTSVKNIMGSSSDYNLTDNNGKYIILLVNDNDYRVF